MKLNRKSMTDKLSKMERREIVSAVQKSDQFRAIASKANNTAPTDKPDRSTPDLSGATQVDVPLLKSIDAEKRAFDGSNKIAGTWNQERRSSIYTKATRMTLAEQNSDPEGKLLKGVAQVVAPAASNTDPPAVVDEAQQSFGVQVMVVVLLGIVIGGGIYAMSK
jgi:hypothetical protein